jgi:hypothetical protein
MSRRQRQDRGQSQGGQALVGALVALVIVFAVAGGLAVAVSALFAQQVSTRSKLVTDLAGQNGINAAASWVMAHAASQPACPGSTALPALGASGEITGAYCMQVDNVAASTAGVLPLSWASGCSVTALAGTSAAGRHSIFWLNGVGGVSAYIDGSGPSAGCGGISSARCKGSSGAAVAQVTVDCDLAAIPTAFLHVSSASQTPSMARFGLYTAPFLPAPGSPYSVGTRPWSIVAADLNRDGRADVVVPNHSDDTVSVLLASGSLSFQRQTYRVGGDPIAVAVADFDGDGAPDLAVLNADDDTVTILLNNGDGSFRSAPGGSVTVPDTTTAFVAGDFNGDGKPDLAVASGSPGRVSVLPGQGDGTFASALSSTFQLGALPSAMASADIDGDGRRDVVVTEGAPSQVDVLLGKGDGTFAAASQSPFRAGSGAVWIAIGDLNGDGRRDLAIANGGTANVTVLLNSGSGNFAPAPGSPIAVGFSPTSVAIGDLDGDGRATDLAVAGSSSVAVLVGSAGSFRALSGSPFAVGTLPYGIAAADFDADGLTDLATADQGSNTVSVLRANGSPRGSVYSLVAPAGGGRPYEEADLFLSTGRSPSTVLRFEGGL